jgi:hypothetical protein
LEELYPQRGNNVLFPYHGVAMDIYDIDVFPNFN